MTTDAIERKKEQLFNSLGKLQSLAVGLSGGVDSSLLIAAARQILGDRVIALTAKSPTHPERELQQAAHVARTLNIKHILFETDEMQDARFTANGPNRCYYCKKRLFGKMRKLADETGIETLAHGANLDDLSDHRPGMRAAEALGVVAPLSLAGLTKTDVRQLARMMGLSNWNRPSMACLATRIPYGIPIEHDVLLKIDQAEMLVYQAGISQCRIRHHGNLARIEIDMVNMEKLMDTKIRQKLIEQMRALGYKFVCLDMEGYQSGKMNRELS